jgi:predicted  nucleic acid-binding Zn-ribbon protein
MLAELEALQNEKKQLEEKYKGVAKKMVRASENFHKQLGEVSSEIHAIDAKIRKIKHPEGEDDY